jgi:hypothetical protein
VRLAGGTHAFQFFAVFLLVLCVANNAVANITTLTGTATSIGDVGCTPDCAIEPSVFTFQFFEEKSVGFGVVNVSAQNSG